MDEPAELGRQPSPFIGIWLKPRATMRQLLDAGYDRWNYLLAAVYGIEYASYAPESVAAEAWWPFTVSGVLWILLSALIGMLLLPLRAWALNNTVEFMRGEKSYAKVRGAIAWSGLIGGCSSVLWLVACLAISIGFEWAPEFTYSLYEPDSILSYLLLTMPFQVLGVWALVAEIKCVGEATNLSFFRTWGALIFSGAYLMVALIIPAIVGLCIYMAVFMPAS